MSAITDMPSAVNGAKKESFVILINAHLPKSISGKSGAAEGQKVLDDVWKPGGILAYSKARKPPGFSFLFTYYILHIFW